MDQNLFRWRKDTKILISKTDRGESIAVIEGKKPKIVSYHCENKQTDFFESLYGVSPQADYFDKALEESFNAILLDNLDDLVESIIIDNEEMQQRIIALLAEKLPQYIQLVTLYQGEKDLFKKYQLESIDEVYQKEINDINMTADNVIGGYNERGNIIGEGSKREIDEDSEREIEKASKLLEKFGWWFMFVTSTILWGYSLFQGKPLICFMVCFGWLVYHLAAIGRF